MATKIRVVRAVGATGSVLLTGLRDGIPVQSGDQYTKVKHQVYVPESEFCSEWGPTGTMVSTLVQGYSDLAYTEDVQRQMQLDGSLTTLIAAGHLASATSYNDTTIAQGTLTGAAGSYPADLVITGARMLSLAPTLTSVYAVSAALSLGTVVSATKNTSALAGDNQLILRDPVTGDDISIFVTSGAAVPNARIVKEIMLGAISHGLDAVAVDTGAGIAVASSLGSLIVRPSGLAVILGLTAGTYSPASRGSANAAEIVAAGGSVAAGSITVPSGLIPGATSGDLVFVTANGASCQSSSTIDGQLFTWDFVIVA